MTDDGKYNFMQNETSNYNSQNFENFQNTQNSNNYIYSPNQCNPYIDYNNIKSLADIPHKLIKQLSPNEFYISFKKQYRWLPLLSLLVIGGFCAGLICIQIFDDDSDSKNAPGIYIGIFITGFLFIFVLIAFIINHISLNIILEENSIRFIYTWNFSCFHSTKIIRRGDILRFAIELSLRNKKETIIYFDAAEDRKILISLKFFGDEANYLVYILNNHLQTMLNNAYNNP